MGDGRVLRRWKKLVVGCAIAWCSSLIFISAVTGTLDVPWVVPVVIWGSVGMLTLYAVLTDT